MNGADHHVARRRENQKKAAGDPATDPQGLVEFGCECSRSEDRKSVV